MLSTLRSPASTLLPKATQASQGSTSCQASSSTNIVCFLRPERRAAGCPSPPGPAAADGLWAPADAQASALSEDRRLSGPGMPSTPRSLRSPLSTPSLVGRLWLDAPTWCHSWAPFLTGSLLLCGSGASRGTPLGHGYPEPMTKGTRQAFIVSPGHKHKRLPGPPLNGTSWVHLLWDRALQPQTAPTLPQSLDPLTGPRYPPAQTQRCQVRTWLHLCPRASGERPAGHRPLRVPQASAFQCSQVIPGTPPRLKEVKGTTGHLM